jgi:hypothetical protein
MAQMTLATNEVNTGGEEHEGKEADEDLFS